MLKRIGKYFGKFFKKKLPKASIKNIEVEISVTDPKGNLKSYRKIKNGRTLMSSDAN